MTFSTYEEDKEQRTDPPITQADGPSVTMVPLQELPCPFPECSWSYRYDPSDEQSREQATEQADNHYLSEHAGTLEVTVEFTFTRPIGRKTADHIHDEVIAEFESGAPESVTMVETSVLDSRDGLPGYHERNLRLPQRMPTHSTASSDPPTPAADD